MTTTEAPLLAVAVERVEHSVTDVAAEARAFVVTDQASMDAAGEFLRLRVKAVLREADAAFDPIIKAAHDAHKVALAQKQRITAPLLTAETTVKRAIGDYAARVRAEQEAERRRLEAEARQRAEAEQLERAAALEAQGAQQEAAAVLEAPVVVAPVRPVAPPPPATPKGVSTRTVYRFRIVNPAAIKADYLCPNEGAIAAIVKSQGPKAVAIVGPGIEVYEETVVSARAS